MREEASGSVRLWAVTLGLALVAVVLGMVGLHLYLPHTQDYQRAGVGEQLYYTAQMFVLGSTPVEQPPYPVPLLLAVFLAPFTTVLALLQTISVLFRTRWAAWRLRQARGHAVVTGPGAEAFVLAQKLADEPAAPRWWHRLARRRTWTTTTVLVGSDVAPDVARRHDVQLVAGDPLDAKTLRAAGVPGAARVFAFSDSGAANAGVALLTLTLRGKGAGDEPAQPPRPGVAVYARADDPELVAAMRARRLGAEGREPDDGYTLDFVDIARQAAVALLDKTDTDGGRGAAVVGSDPVAAAVETELRRRRRRTGASGAVTRVRLDRCEDVPPDADRVYVSDENPDRVVRTGLQLLLRGDHQVVLCLGRTSVLAEALESRLFDVTGRLTVFGVLDAALDPAALQRRALVEQLARALHAHYERTYGTGGQASHVPWKDLAEPYRADNRAQAEHVGIKLAAIGALVVPATPGLPDFAFDPTPDTHGLDEVERLAIMEHARWMAVKQRAGVRWGPERTPTTHPDYLPWRRADRTGAPAPGEPDELPEDVKEKDRVFVRELPAILEVEGLAIMRRTPRRSGG